MNLANRITVARILLIPLFFIFLTPFPQYLFELLLNIQLTELQSELIALTIFLLAAITDKLDGFVARKYNQVTKLGKLLDPLADKLLISVAIIALVSKQEIAAWVALIIIGREMMVTLLRIMATSKGMILAADKYGKIKMVLQVSAIVALLLQSQFMNHHIVVIFAQTILYIATAVTLYSGYNYMQKNYRVLMG
jgi:CDP-diacylglycerol--glycerol-3-phosphate 3-phosphatidyltransferase